MFKKTLIAAALAVAATGSFAQVYVQGAIGNGNITGECAVSCDKSNSGNKIVVGYAAGNGISYEGQIINYGKVVFSGVTGDIKGTGYGGNVAYSGSFNDNFGYTAKAGLGINKLDDSASATKKSTNSTQLTLGAGLNYNFNKSTALTLDYDISSAKLNNTTSTTTHSLSLLSVGLRYKF